MRRVNIIALLTTLAVVLAAFTIKDTNINTIFTGKSQTQTKIGILCIGDSAMAYVENFLNATEQIEKEYGDRVEIIPAYNVAEGEEEESLQRFADEGCRLIISTSYGYGENVKKFAAEHPDIECCQATCANANAEPVLENYHTFMGEIYQGRYICGVVAGMKLEEMLKEGKAEEPRVGYVAAFPYAEVISGYTAFFLGARSIVPDAVMDVIYANTWGNYALEKTVAAELIDRGCVIISQHSDTVGPASACEESDKEVYHVGYNKNMANIAPTAYLVGCRINWTPYIRAAVKAVLSDKKIESCVNGNIYGKDAGAGFDRGWVEMLDVNTVVAAEGTQETVDKLIKQFKRGKTDVFKGNYTGTDPYDGADTCDLSQGYTENASSSAPTFHYVLDDIITIVPFEE